MPNDHVLAHLLRRLQQRALSRMQEANREANTGSDLNDVLPWLRTIRELVTAMTCEAHLLQTFPVMMQAFLLLVEAQTIEAEAKQIVIDCN